jgi:hypothetical protein
MDVLLYDSRKAGKIRFSVIFILLLMPEFKFKQTQQKLSPDNVSLVFIIYLK